MNTAQSYKVNQDYSGQRNVLVPTRMYSRNTLLNAMHIKSDKYLGINLDRYVMTFHSDKTCAKGDPGNEVAFSKIKSLEADVTKADSGKYYLKVHTDEGDLSFKFKNARDFHTVVEALRNTIHNDKPFYDATESYRNSVNVKPHNIDRSRSNSSVSSDNRDEYKAVDGHKAKKEINANRKGYLEANKECFKANKDVIEDNKFDACRAKDVNKDMYRANNDMIKNEYDIRRENAKAEYTYNKEINKDAAKRELSIEKEGAKDIREAQISHNKVMYKEHKEGIKVRKDIDKEVRENLHENNKQAKEFAEENIKDDAEYHKKELKSDIKNYKLASGLDEDIAKNNINADVYNAKDNMRNDLQTANDIRKARY
jgi:hypothetical protein